MAILKDLNEEISFKEISPKKVNVKDRYFLKLRDDFNPEEVEHFGTFVAQRLYNYHTLHFLDFIPPTQKIETKVELLKDYDNTISEKKETFYQVISTINEEIVNPIANINNGADKITVNWSFSMCFIDLKSLPKVAIVNVEDLPFKTKGAAIFMRSTLAEVVRKYASEYHPEKFRRNFELLSAEDERFEATAREMISKLQDLSLSREKTVEMLANMKDQITGASGSSILAK